MSILCYHTVEPGWSSPLAMSPQALEQHCDWLTRHRTVLPLDEAVRYLDRTWRLPARMTALTFDDGLAGLHAHALPILARRRLPATVFLVAQTLTPSGQAVDWVDTAPEGTLETLTLDQVGEMQEAGFTFESHSWAHRDLTTLSFEECVRDLRESRELLESLLGRRVRLLAYPRGRHNEDVRAAARQAGYTHAFALPETRESPGRFAVPRVGIHRGNDVRTLRVKSTRGYLALRTSPAYRLASRQRPAHRKAPAGSA